MVVIAKLLNQKELDESLKTPRTTVFTLTSAMSTFFVPPQIDWWDLANEIAVGKSELDALYEIECFTHKTLCAEFLSPGSLVFEVKLKKMMKGSDDKISWVRKNFTSSGTGYDTLT